MQRVAMELDAPEVALASVIVDNCADFPADRVDDEGGTIALAGLRAVAALGRAMADSADAARALYRDTAPGTPSAKLARASGHVFDINIAAALTVDLVDLYRRATGRAEPAGSR
jgi:hypothetical protein